MSSIAKLLRSGGNNLGALETHLQEDLCAAILLLDGGQPVLIAAMHWKCSVPVIRLLLEHGAQPEQVDRYGRNALEALVAMDVPLDYRTHEGNPSPVVASLHVRYAITLLAFGARPLQPIAVGYGNELCQACVCTYADVQAVAIIRQWMQHAEKDFLSIVATFLLKI